MGVGFVYGTILQFTGRPSSQRDPDLFSDIPLFLATSILTGLVLWSLTLFWSFRRVLVFDRGLPTALAAGTGDAVGPGAPVPGFFTFSTARTPEQLVTRVQQAMAESGLVQGGQQALPPVQISSATRLDQA